MRRSSPSNAACPVPQPPRASTHPPAALGDLKVLEPLADETTKKSIATMSAEARRQLALKPREVLGLSPFPADPSQADVEVKKAYRQLCLQHHPDKHAASSSEVRQRSKHRFERIQAAYEKLLPANRTSGFRSSAYGGYGGF